MNAFAMLAASAGCQWRGLTESERARLTAAWDRKDLQTAHSLRIVRIAQVETPIWIVAYEIGHSVTLLSAKHDFLEDVPA